jgi:hypothetical protein
VGSWGAIIPPCGWVAAWREALSRGLAYFLAFLTVFRGAEAFLAAGLTVGAVGLGASPITDFSGHTLKTGHFWQPTAMAIGQMVMVGLEVGRW